MLEQNNNSTYNRRVLPDLSGFMDCRTASQIHVIELRKQSEVQKQRLQ
uniref:Uncharacterized protein n=1 Tax=Acrobeloides nanus TaxID=290746 RepID=A0A914CWX2_9BILA